MELIFMLHDLKYFWYFSTFSVFPLTSTVFSISFHTICLCLENNWNIWILLIIPVFVIMSLKYPGHLLNTHDVGWQICFLPDLSAHKSKMERNLAVHPVWSQLYTIAVTNFICIALCQSLFAISAISYFSDSLQMCTLLCNTRVPHCHWVDSLSVKFACGKPRNQKSFYTKQVQYCLVILLLYCQKKMHICYMNGDWTAQPLSEPSTS